MGDAQTRSLPLGTDSPARGLLSGPLWGWRVRAEAAIFCESDQLTKASGAGRRNGWGKEPQERTDTHSRCS